MSTPVDNPVANRTLTAKAGSIASRAGLNPDVAGTILDLLKSLFAQLLGGFCPAPTPAALHARLTGTSGWYDRPANLEDRMQRRQLERSAGSRFHRDTMEYVLAATWAEKMAMTVEDCTNIINERAGK